MTPTAVRAQGCAELQSVNLALAALLRVEPLLMSAGAETAARDELVVCGILGGKDVGKSTLINALAQTTVSVDDTEVGPGTRRPVAYVHHAVEHALRERLKGLGADLDLEIRTHAADAIRNAVLVDLPDFDSEFRDHLETVRRVRPLLDRILWLLTPRKIGDRIWVAMVADTLQDRRNTVLVLNKLDELLADDDALGSPAVARGGTSRSDLKAPGEVAERFRARNSTWVMDTARSACGEVEGERVFLLAAAYPTAREFERRIAHLWDDPEWKTYAADRAAVVQIAQRAAGELEELRHLVLSSVGDAEAASIKTANVRRETAELAMRLRGHYALDSLVRSLQSMCDADYLMGVLRTAVDREFLRGLAERVRRSIRQDRQLADDLLEARLDGWPLLRLVYWPFGWVSRSLGRRVAGTHNRASPAATDPLDGPGPSLHSRVDLIRSRILADHAPAAERFYLDAELPAATQTVAQASVALAQLPLRIENELLDEIRAEDLRRRQRFSGQLRRWCGAAALWLVLLWFPFGQPIAAAALQTIAEDGVFSLAKAGYQLVRAFSAPHILAGFAVVAGVYVAALAVMYSRCLRDVRARVDRNSTTTSIESRVWDALLESAIEPCVGPIAKRLERLEAMSESLTALAGGSTTTAMRAA